VCFLITYKNDPGRPLQIGRRRQALCFSFCPSPEERTPPGSTADRPTTQAVRPDATPDEGHVGIWGYASRAPRVCGGYGGRYLRPAGAKVNALGGKGQGAVKLAVRNHQRVERKVVESFVGIVCSLALAVSETGYYLRRLQYSLSRGSGTSSGAAKKRDGVRLSHGR
jgi:hypothetical protein